MLCTALYGSTSQQKSSKGSCSLLVSGHNLRTDCQLRTSVPLLNSGANAASASVHALVKAMLELNNRQWRVVDIRSLTGDEWSYPSYCYSWELSDPRIAEQREMPLWFSIKLHSETQVSGRLGMAGGRSPRHAHNPLPVEQRKTLSITHHALSPPPSHHHLYIIYLIN